MGEIALDTPKGEFVFEIKGDQPSSAEIMKIQSAIRDLGVDDSIKSTATTDKEQIDKEIEQLFDTKTGIKDASLRGSLSAAENRGEEDLIFGKFNILEGEYLRDKRGRLALTPEGAAKLGLTVERNTLIDEDGFSRYDLADLGGIAPELIGGVTGAMKGAAIGSAVPGIGTLFGGMVGAALGAGGGQALEEVVEATAGVSKQSAGSIAKDIATEAAIGFVGEGLFGAIGKAFGAGKRSMTAGKELTSEELETAGKSLEMGIYPTLSAIRAPSVIARTQAIGEKIFKTSDRLKKNNDVMTQKINEFKNLAGSNTADEAGEALLKGLEENNTALIKAEAEARKAVLKQFEDTANSFGSADARNASINDEVFEMFADAQMKFDENMTLTFKAVDSLMKNRLGSKGFINVKELAPKGGSAVEGSLEDLTKRGLSDFAGATEDSTNVITNALKGIQLVAGKDFTKPISFNQLYNIRKTMNDAIVKSESTVGRQLDPILDKIDNIMSRENLVIKARDANLTSGELTLVENASKQLVKARKDFAKGKKILENLDSNIVLKNLENFVKREGRDAKRTAIDPQIYKDLIKKDRPQFLEASFKVLNEFGKPGEALKLRKELANNFIRDNLTKSGIDSISPQNFSGKAFADAVDNLGTSGDVLFGGATEYAGIKSLANQIRQTSLGKMDDAVIKDIMDQGGSQNLKGLLQSVRDTQVNLHNLQTSALRKKLSSGTLNATEAGELIANKSTQANQIDEVLESFRIKGDEESVKKVQGYFMNSLIDDFGETVMTDSTKLNKFADRMLDASKGNKLNIIYGSEMGKNMAEFAKILKFNARTAEGGDLVAASIAASPLQNIGSLIRFSIIGKYLTSAPYYNQILNQYKIGVKVAKTDAERAMTLGQAMRNAFSQGPIQSAQEGINEGEKQLKSLADSSGITSALKNTANQVRTNVRPSTPTGTGINVTPPASNTGLGQINVNSPGTGALLGLSPVNQAIAARQQP